MPANLQKVQQLEETRGFAAIADGHLKALVTGGSGFIGSHLVEALLERRWAVRCLVRSAGGGARLQKLPVECCAGDCRDRASLLKAVRGVDVVFHLAGVTRALDARGFFEVNAAGADNLVRACVDCNPGLKRFVHVSSQAAAGPSAGTAVSEADPCAPVSAYGRSKRRGEQLVLGQGDSVPVVVIRPPVVYGPRDRDLLPFFRILSHGIRPRLAGSGQRFSLCYVSDVVRGLLLAGERDAAKGEVFFLSDGRDYGWDDIGGAFAAAVGRRTRRVSVPRILVRAAAVIAETAAGGSGRPPLLNRDKVREMLQRDWVCDSSKAVRLLGFAPLVGVGEGARLTFAWYRAAGWI